MQILAEAQAIAPWIVELRRKLHRHPELMFQEFETSRLVRETLAALGIRFEHSVAETGVVAMIGRDDGPCVALRADMDALPIHEQAEVEFRSQIDGKMHACGHDCHTSMLLGAARLLKAREAELRGSVKLIFQPAEEGAAGAERMCEAGVLESPHVKRIFGLHVWPYLPAGTVACPIGPVLAAAGMFDVTVHGKGGHGAMPHLAIDPVTCAAKIIMEWQTIVSREMNPCAPSVVTVGSIAGGDTDNVIPAKVRLTGTMRSFSPTGIEQLRKRVEEIAAAVAQANRCTVEFAKVVRDVPPTLNDAASAALARRAAETTVGTAHIAGMEPVLGAEDFAYYQQRVPGFFGILGVGDPAWDKTFSIHHPCFRVNEAALPVGAAWHVAMAMEALADV